MRVLAGDIGGTKTLVALFETETRPFRVIREQRFDSHAFDGLSAVLRAFLAEGAERASAACFAIAGPVIDGEVNTPNLPWHVSTQKLVTECDLPRTDLVNDFIAVGYGLEQLGAADLVTLQAGKPVAGGPIGVLGAGTGLGEAFVLWDGDRSRVHASEGGHADFAARNLTEDALLAHLRHKFPRVSYERILSGHGLENVFRFLDESGTERAAPEVLRAIESEDPAAVITRHALAKSDRACERALDIFASVYGAEAGNLALRLLATGGIYLAGGIAPRIVDKLREPTFAEAFRGKGRLSSFVESVPVHVITNTRVGLLGAAVVAAQAARS